MVYKTGSWDLKEITPQSIDSEMKLIEEQVVRLEKVRTLLKEDMDVSLFMRIIKDFELLHIKTERLGVYCHLRFCENAGDQRAVADMGRVEQYFTTVSNRLMFFSLWFKKIDSSAAARFISASGKYKYYLEQLRLTAQYTLSEKEERVVNIKDSTGVSALNTVYNIFTSKFVYEWEGKKITQEELVAHVRDTKPAIRKKAYLALLSQYKEHREVIGEIYKNIVNDWRSESIDLRGYKSPISVRNVGNDIPDAAVEALLSVCARNEKLFHRFFALKAKRLKMKKLTRFDLYAPLGAEKKNISYHDAVSMVLESYSRFHPEFVNRATAILDGKHVHSAIVKGKRSGAFCCGVGTQLLPYVMLSYNGTPRAVSTLAHELGHGIHFSLASCQTEFTMDACLPMAETASIFGEMLLSETLLEKDPDAFDRMTFDKLDDLYASIIRQAGFVRFEIEAHEMMKHGATIDEVSARYLELLKGQFGKSVEVDPIYSYEWLYIPHIFHTPFYCYAYAFGNLLTLALYEMYREDKAFASKVVDMLKLGGSRAPVDIARLVGVDITSEAFWQKGFDVIEGMLEKVEKPGRKSGAKRK